MQAYSFTDFSDHILHHSIDELTHSPLLHIASSGRLSSFYTPFDSINLNAKIVFVGICPGQLQWKNALTAAQNALKEGLGTDEALKHAKTAGAFSGPIRKNLVQILDHIGLQHKLSIASTVQLFSEHQSMVQMTSVLRQCILVNGKNYAGTSPNMLKNDFLKQHIEQYFVPEIQLLPDAIYIPFGNAVIDVLYSLSNLGYLKEQQILDGFPHPSGANSERIKYFLGQKKASDLSPATNAELIDQAKIRLLNKLKHLNI
ncbi:MAG: hypothetical protein ACN6NX_07605 [Acinetobacter sp.]